MASSGGFQLRGAKAMQRQMERIARRFPDKVKAAIYQEAEMIMTDSKQNYVPIDQGVLRSSGFVNPPERQGREISIVMGFGGAAEAYALSVHETPSPHDPPSWRGSTVTFHPSGRGPKYLEKPLNAAINGMADRIAERLDPDVE